MLITSSPQFLSTNPTKQTMMKYPLTLSLLLLSVLPHPSTSTSLHRPSLSSSLHTQKSPLRFFEVTHPIPTTPTTTTPCSHPILSHSFAYTYGQPPVLTPYAPPSHCTFTPRAAVLSLSATCIGRQFDRIFSLWLDGVELLRSCTAEPTQNGIVWSIQKDISKYLSLLTTTSTNSTLALYLGNIVDHTYTGIYHFNFTIHFYPGSGSASGYGHGFADLIMPISRSLPLNDGLWFEITSPSQAQQKSIVIPKNAYRAVLEVYVSFHENDEFWYTNLNNNYLVANNLSGQTPGNGPFREVLVSLDGGLVGAVWPFTVIFTGGINPLLWRPISGIGSFDLPSYDVEITPFLGRLLDGKAHEFGFRVTNALNVWYVDANLHLWLDENGAETKGETVVNEAEPLTFSSRSDFKGLDGNFFTGASRSIVSTGWVESSYGNVTTTSIQEFEYINFMALGNDGGLQTVNQTIEFNTSVTASLPSSPSMYRSESYKRFPLFVYTNQADQANSSYSLYSNVTLGFNEDKLMESEGQLSSSSLRNKQNGEGTMLVKNNLVVTGLGSTKQIYEYDESSGKFCYFRNVSSSNYTILYDEVRDTCKPQYRNYVSSLASHSIPV